MAKHGRIKKVERRAEHRRHKIHNKGMAQKYSDLIKKKEEQVNGNGVIGFNTERG